MTATKPEVTQITNLSGLQALEEEWHNLEGRCPGLSVFSSFEWCGSIAEHYVADAALRLLVMRQNGEMVGLAPLAEVCLLGGLRLLRHAGTGLGRYSLADYQDLLIAKGHEDSVIEALCDSLAQRSMPWDVLHLQELPAASRTTERLAAAAAKKGWLVEQKPASDVHPLDLPESWEVYRMCLSRKTRASIERRTRKLMAEQRCSFVHVNGGEGEVERGMESLFDLHTQRWGAYGDPGIFRAPRKRRFHLDVAKRLAHRGMLNLSLIKVDEETVAANYSFEYNHTHCYYAGGYLPGGEWSCYGLGTVLDAYDLQQAIKRGLRRMDFLRGEGHYKDRFRAATEVNQELLIYRSAAARLHYRAAHLMTSGLLRLRDKVGKHPEDFAMVR